MDNIKQEEFSGNIDRVAVLDTKRNLKQQKKITVWKWGTSHGLIAEIISGPLISGVFIRFCPTVILNPETNLGELD